MPRTESLRPPAGATALDVQPPSSATAPPSETWPELMPDAFVLPAAVEAAQATADEGPGPWPPVVADDPAEAPFVAPANATKAVRLVSGTAHRRGPLQGLKRLLHQVRTGGRIPIE